MRQLPGSVNETNYTLRGEATVVQVLPGRPLCAAWDSEDRLFAAAKDRVPCKRRVELPQELLGQTEPVSPLPYYVPMMATFEEFFKPKTAGGGPGRPHGTVW
jgi:hypothetical protein